MQVICARHSCESYRQRSNSGTSGSPNKSQFAGHRVLTNQSSFRYLMITHGANQNRASKSFPPFLSFFPFFVLFPPASLQLTLARKVRAPLLGHSRDFIIRYAAADENNYRETRFRGAPDVRTLFLFYSRSRFQKINYKERFFLRCPPHEGGGGVFLKGSVLQLFGRKGPSDAEIPEIFQLLNENSSFPR